MRWDTGPVCGSGLFKYYKQNKNSLEYLTNTDAYLPDIHKPYRHIIRTTVFRVVIQMKLGINIKQVDDITVKKYIRSINEVENKLLFFPFLILSLRFPLSCSYLFSLTFTR